MFKNFRSERFHFWGGFFTEILVWQRIVALNFLSHRNLAPHYMPWSSKEILQKLYCCFEDFFLLFLSTLDMVVLQESSLVLSLSNKFLADLKLFVWFSIFCLPNIVQKVLEHCLHSRSHLILPQIFGPFDC